ncbi:hypothetical protein [Propionicicella superfundia]|uniref:hypothetical protein n=1 Tax=Propionicicella superfundia TaxID=348582 RepID=UPI00041392E8|nr:hypothetical protein [Propionicicella superfundia]
MRFQQWVVAGAMLALVTACTAPVSPAPSTVSGPAVSVSSGTPTAIPGYVEAREGVDYEVLFDVPNPRPDGKTDVVLTVTPDGRALVGRSTRAIPLNQDEILVKTAHGERSLPQVLGGAPRQAIAAVANDTDMVWLETSSTSLVEAGWDLFTADNKGHVRHLASSDDYGGDTAPPITDYLPLALDASRAYLGIPMPRKDRKNPADPSDYYNAILAVPLDGSTPEILVDDARLAATGSDGIHFVRTQGIRTTDLDRPPPTGPMPAGGVAEFGVIPSGGGAPRIVHTEKIAGPYDVSYQCTVGDSLAWLTGALNQGDRGRITILAPDGTTTIIPLYESGLASYLTCGDGLIAWAGGGEDGMTEDIHEDTGQYVYSLATRTTWRIGENDIVSTSLVNGKIVMVSTPAQNETGPVGSRVLRWLH